MRENFDGKTEPDHQIVIAYGFSTVEAMVLAETAGRSRVRFCRSMAAAASAVSEHGVIGAAIAVTHESHSDVHAVIDAFDRRAVPIPLLLRFDLSGSAVGQVLEYCDSVYDVRVSLRGFDPLRGCVASLTSSSNEHAARRAIMSRIAPLVPLPVRDIVFAAVILGERRSTVRELAAICGRSRRTLEQQLAAAGMPHAKWLLMQALVVHSHWRVSRLQWTPGRAAARAGFRSVHALSRRVERAAGVRLSRCNETLAFSDELEQFAEALRSRQSLARM